MIKVEKTKSGSGLDVLYLKHFTNNLKITIDEKHGDRFRLKKFKPNYGTLVYDFQIH